MKILIIDNNIPFVTKLKRDISCFFDKYDIRIYFDVFYNDYQIIDFHQQYDIAFINIDFKNQKGIHLAKDIKQYNSSTYVVFSSSQQCPCHLSFTVQPYFFIRGPHYLEDFYTFCELIKESLLNKKMIQLNYKSNKIILHVQDIIYIESMQHTLNIHTQTNVYQDNRALKEIIQLLPRQFFIQIHKSFIINCQYVSSISRKEVTLHSNHDIKVTISRTYLKTFENKYETFLLL